jgi:predicted peptidase
MGSKNRRFLLCLLCLCAEGLFAAEKPEESKAPKFIPGEQVRIDTDDEDIGGDHFLIYVPFDYTDDRKWPVIFFYHGASGRPTTDLIRQTTAGLGFIIVGMGYVEGGKGPLTKGEYLNQLKRERKSVLKVKRYVAEHLKVDEQRLFIAGFSKGGWHTSAMLEFSGKVWAGAVILAAGRSRTVASISTAAGKRALRGKPLYIGAGQKDPNLEAAKIAQKYYRRAGANVTFEEYEGLGHSYDPKVGTLREWLFVNASVENEKSEKTKKDAETEQND